LVFEVFDEIRLFLLSFGASDFLWQVVLGLYDVDGLAAFLDFVKDVFWAGFVGFLH